MQNNVTELTQRLLRALDSNYNVIDMPSVIEIISLLEKVAITKELLETTRLGKHVNELRRNTTNESLAKRAKELVKKWRSMVLPDSNGQLQERKRPAKDSTTTAAAALTPNNNKTSGLENSVATAAAAAVAVPAKRPRINGQASEFEFSDNSNSSFKDVIGQNTAPVTELKQRDVIVVNSDSNSSLPGGGGGGDPQLEQQMPKKRGRKKGSKNHRNLLDEAETSFTNKMAVSRGNAKVKTTKELIASLQNKNSAAAVSSLPPPPLKPIEDLNERAAKLTERVSIIDQKLNTNANRYKNAQKKRPPLTSSSSERVVVESGSVVNIKSESSSSSVKTEQRRRDADDYDDDDDDDDEVVVVVDDDVVDEQSVAPAVKTGETEEAVETRGGATTVETAPAVAVVASLSVEEALAKLPPIDPGALEEEGEDAVPTCSCQLREKRTEDDLFPVYEIEEDHTCGARAYLERRYHLGEVTEERVNKLHSEFVENVNGNVSLGGAVVGPALRDDGLFVDVVPKVNSECLPKDPKPCENYKKYSISEERTVGEGKTFREWHEVVEMTSYDGEILKILPYCIID